ncbi:MAG: 4Fe-4S binding protein [Desulfobacterales bacterium]|nr:4Fe-4S binding protein [Desulfobacterales bacterium]
MSIDIYRRLAHHLDDLPGGFPPTDSGVELRILRRLFSVDEAALAPYLTLIPETSEIVARRSGLDADTVGFRLEEMARKGLIFRIVSPVGQRRYMAAQFVVGIWEFHLNDLNPEFVRDMHEYIPHLLPEAWKVPQLRTIPVGRSITADLHVMPYEKAEELVRRHRKAAVAPCICRREMAVAGKPCDKPEETCVTFGTAADYYLENGLGRPVDAREIIDILQMAEESGLVLQPSNAQRAANICMCCGCCCAVLRNLKTLPRPVDYVVSAFTAAAEADLCQGCEVCVDRCQMDAIRMEEDRPVIDEDRCIGCGLCVTTCPSGALSLVRKPDPEQPEVPKDMVRSALKLARARGKLGLSELVVMQAKSKFDRFLALKRQS